MALVVEKVQRFTFTGTATTPVTFTYAMANGTGGSDRLLLIFMQRDVGGGYAMQYNSTNPTLQVYKETTYAHVVEMWRDTALPTDTSDHTISISFGGNRTDVDVMVLELSGADQTYTPNASSGGVLNNYPHTLTHVTATDGIQTFLFYLRVENRDMNSEPSYSVTHLTGDDGPIHDAHRLGQITGPTPAGSTDYTWQAYSVGSPANSTARFAAVDILPTAGGGGGLAVPIATYYHKRRAA